MSSEFITVLFLVLDLLVPIISGPGAALLYVYILGNNRPRQRMLFWIGYLAWQAFVFFLMTYTLGDLAPGPGFLACWLTPITAVLSFIILWRSKDEVGQATDGDLAARRAYQFGLFLIPTLQIITILAAILLGPLICEIGFRPCFPV